MAEKEKSLWEQLTSGVTREPRRLRAYPKKIETLIKRTKIGAAKTELFRQPRPPIHRATGRLYTTGFDANLDLEGRAQQDIKGSLEERIFYKALVEYGLIPEVDFSYQPDFKGGRMELGGLVADFMFEYPKVIVQVQSYWHTVSLEIEQRDHDQAAQLRGMGFTVMELWPNTIRDAVALDWWVQRNIGHLYGTSYQPFGNSHARDLPYLEAIFSDFGGIEALARWNTLAQEIYEAINPFKRVR